MADAPARSLPEPRHLLRKNPDDTPRFVQPQRSVPSRHDPRNGLETPPVGRAHRSKLPVSKQQPQPRIAANPKVLASRSNDPYDARVDPVGVRVRPKLRAV